ncbi:hypothetical protein DL762_002053 [Monosporascus cannonballus]|uniref:Uncharacterized protein n=1 Tax=Monosporascus cannonballus TaxID=155416 RepID=A0ABY0HIT8_9PEZI|nr:hypothetical protein DL762_002053 [Monosporascus cannonballus]
MLLDLPAYLVAIAVSKIKRKRAEKERERTARADIESGAAGRRWRRRQRVERLPQKHEVAEQRREVSQA